MEFREIETSCQSAVQATAAETLDNLIYANLNPQK